METLTKYSVCSLSRVAMTAALLLNLSRSKGFGMCCLSVSRPITLGAAGVPEALLGIVDPFVIEEASDAAKASDAINLMVAVCV